MPSKFLKRQEYIKQYWREVFTPNRPLFETAMAFSIVLLYLVYILGMVWMVPWSVAKAWLDVVDEKQN
jgi:hypothetical protein